MLFSSRCGIMHARGTVPSGKVTPVEIEEYCANFEKKMGSFLQPRPNLTEDEASKLGEKEGRKRDADLVTVYFKAAPSMLFAKFLNNYDVSFSLLQKIVMRFQHCRFI